MGLLLLFTTFSHCRLVLVWLQGLQSLDFSVSGVDVVAPLLTLGYLASILFLCCFALSYLSSDVVRGGQPRLPVEDNALLGVDSLVDF